MKKFYHSALFRIAAVVMLLMSAVFSVFCLTGLVMIDNGYFIDDESYFSSPMAYSEVHSLAWETAAAVVSEDRDPTQYDNTGWLVRQYDLSADSLNVIKRKSLSGYETIESFLWYLDRYGGINVWSMDSESDYINELRETLEQNKGGSAGRVDLYFTTPRKSSDLGYKEYQTYYTIAAYRNLYAPGLVAGGCLTALLLLLCAALSGTGSDVYGTKLYFVDRIPLELLAGVCGGAALTCVICGAELWSNVFRSLGFGLAIITLTTIAAMVFDNVAYKNVISTGLVLDAKGNKMSKRLGNVTSPFEMIEKHGADAVRFYMMTNSEPWDNLKFDPEGVAEVGRKFFGTLYNTYSFFALYANVDGFDSKMPEVKYDERPEIDRWILSSLHSLVKKVDAELQDYDPTRAGRLIAAFVNDDLSNWYVRLNRKRFWGKEMSTDKLSAYQTLYTCLLTISKLLAPFAPFYADELYCDLGGSCDSVHLDTFPQVDEALIDRELEERMGMAQKITSMVLALRRKVNIKVRQPLSTIMIPATDNAQKQHIEAVKELVLSEVNVKELNFVDGLGILVKKVKCNFRTMGKKFGKLMKGVAAQMAELSQEEIAEFEKNKTYTMTVDGEQVVVDVEDVEIISEDIPGWLVSNEGNLTVALEVQLTDELLREGMARELINRIQNLRKDSGLEITDRIHVVVSPNPQIEEAVASYTDYIQQQVLADSVEIADNSGVEFEFDQFKLNINIKKIDK